MELPFFKQNLVVRHIDDEHFKYFTHFSTFHRISPCYTHFCGYFELLISFWFLLQFWSLLMIFDFFSMISNNFLSDLNFEFRSNSPHWSRKSITFNFLPRTSSVNYPSKFHEKKIHLIFLILPKIFTVLNWICIKCLPFYYQFGFLNSVWFSLEMHKLSTHLSLKHTSVSRIFWLIWLRWLDCLAAMNVARLYTKKRNETVQIYIHQIATFFYEHIFWNLHQRFWSSRVTHPTPVSLLAFPTNWIDDTSNFFLFIPHWLANEKTSFLLN